MTISLLEKLEKLRSGITEIMDEIRSQDQEAGPQKARDSRDNQDNSALVEAMYDHQTSKPICSEDGCYKTEDCGLFCRNRN